MVLGLNIWPFSTMLKFGGSPLVLQLPSPLVTVPITNHDWNNRYLHVPNSFFIPLQGRSTYPSFHFLFALFCGQPVQQSLQF